MNTRVSIFARGGHMRAACANRNAWLRIGDILVKRVSSFSKYRLKNVVWLKNKLCLLQFNYNIIFHNKIT